MKGGGMELGTAQWLVLVFTAFLQGFNKTGIIGCAIVTTPLLLLYFTPGQTLGIILPLLVVADIITLVIMRHSAKWLHILKALPWQMLGIIVGWGIARWALTLSGTGGDVFLTKLIAFLLVALVLFSYVLRWRPDIARSRSRSASEGERPARTWFAAIMGICGGVTTMLANNGGPVWVAYLMTLGLEVKAFIGTAAWLFFIQNVAKIPFAIALGFVTWDTLVINLYLLLPLVVGLAVGKYVAGRVSQGVFDHLTQGLALLAALYLLFA